MSGDLQNARRRAWRRETAGLCRGLLFLCVVCLTILPASAQTTRTWTGSASSDWFNANNWSPPGVPGSNDTINLNGGGITLDAPVTIDGVFNWSAGLLYTNSLTIGSTGVLNITGGTKNLCTALTNMGTVNWLGGEISVDSFDFGNPVGPIVNLAGATWNIESDDMIAVSGFNLVNAYVVNAGTILKTAGTGTTTFNVPVFNTGTMTAESGSFSFPEGFTHG